MSTTDDHMSVEFSPPARKVFSEGAAEANRLRHPRFGAHHMLLAVLGLSDGAAAAVLDALRVDRVAARSWIEDSFPAGDAAPDRGEMPYDTSGMEVLQRAIGRARDAAADRVTTAHVLLGLLQTEEGPGYRALEAAGVDVPALIAALGDHPGGE